jgi:hypothetical protein
MASPVSSRRSLLGLILTVIIPLPLVYIAVMNVAYSSGDMMDLGWLSTVAWHSDLLLTGPPASYQESFFLHHMSPIFWLTSLVSYILPFGRLDYYAFLLGLSYSLYAAGIYCLWMWNDGEPTIRRSLTGAALALLATFSAIGMQALRLPHYEMAMPSFALWFFIMLAQRRIALAAIWFSLCLLIREDAGLHLFGLLFLLGTTQKFTHKQIVPMKRIAGFGCTALAYAFGIMFVQSVLFPDSHKLAQIYTGDPAWQHVTWDFVKERWSFFFTERTTITLPFLVTLIWAAVARNPLLPLGYIAFVPWVVLNVFAFQITAGSLNFYYMFPLWIALGWPLLALHLWPAASPRARQRWPWLIMLLFSLIGWHKDGLIIYPLAKNEFDAHPFALTDEVLHRSASDDFIAYFAANKNLFDGRVDMPVFSLLIDSNDRLNWLATGHRYLSDPPPEAPPLPEMVIYLTDDFEQPLWVAPVLKTGAYGYFYQVPNSRIRIASQKPLDDFPNPKPFVLIAKPPIN